MGRYLKTKVGGRYIVLWNPCHYLFPMDTEEEKKLLDMRLILRKKKRLSKEKRKIKEQQARFLYLFGISDKKLLNKLTRCSFNKILDELDKTEEAIKSNEKIYDRFKIK